MTTIPSALTATNRGNLRLKSLSLRELDEAQSLSLAIDMTVTDQRLKFTGNLDNGTSVNMFSVIGSTTELTTLSVSSVLVGIPGVSASGFVSVSGESTLNQLSVHAVSSDLSVGGSIIAPYISVNVADVGTMNIFAPDTLTVAGNVLFEGGEFRIEGSDGAFAVTREISAGASITCRTTLSIGSFADIGGSLSVGNQAAIGSNTSIGGTLTATDYAEIGGDLSVGGTDTTLDTHLSVSGELAVRQDAVFDQSLSVEGNLTTASKLSVGSAVRLSSILNVHSVSTFHARMSVHGPFDVEGTVSIGEAITAASTLSVQGLSTIGTLSAGTSTLDSLNVRTDCTIDGDLTVKGNTITLNTSQVDIEDPIIEIGQGLITETLAGIKIIKDTTASNDQSGFFRERESDDGVTPSFFAVYEDFNDTGLNPVKNVGNFRVSQLSTNSGAFLGGALSVGGHVDILNSLFVKENLSLSGFVHAEGDLSIGGSVSVDASMEMNGVLSVGSDVTSGGRLSVQSSADIVGTTQIASKLSVTDSVTFASDLSVASDVQANGKLRVAETLSAGSFAVIDGSLSVSGSFVLDDYISASGHGTIGQSLSVADVAVMTPSSGSNIFTVKSGSEITLTADNTGDPIHIMEFDEPPTKITLQQAGTSKMNIEYTTNGTNTAPPITYDETTEKWVVPLQYLVNTPTPALVPNRFIIETPRPYVTSHSFKIFNTLTQSYIHDTLDLIPISMFTADSGNVIPTVSVSGDIVSGSALSVGHDIHCHGNTLFSNGTKRVGIRGKLSVHDDVNINQRVIIGGRDDSFLSIGSDTSVRQLLSVGGNTVFASEMSVGQTAVFEKDMEIKESLSVGGILTTNVVIGENSLSVAGLSVSGPVVLADDLSVAFNTVIGVNLSVGAILTTNELSVNSFFAENQTIGNTTLGSLTNTGETELHDYVEMGSTLSVASGVVIGNVSLGGASLSVGGSVDFADSLFMDGTLSVTDSVTLEGDTFLNNTLDVSGATKIDSILSVTGETTLSSELSVGGAAEFTSHLYVRESEAINKHLSVGRHMTVSRQLSVADTITGGRDLSVGGLVLDRERTKTRYFLIGQPANNGLQIKTTSAGQEFLFNLADGRLYSVFSFQDNGEFVVRSPENVSVEWFEVNSSLQQGDFLEVRGLITDNILSIDFGAPGSSPTAPVVAGLTALSVGHNMTIGKDGEATFLSVGSSLDVTGRTQIGNSLSVSGAVYIASTLSTNGDLDVVTNARVGGGISVGGAGIIGSTLSIQGDTTISSKLSVHGDLDVLNKVRFANDLSVNGNLDVKEDTRLHGSLSVNGLSIIDGDLSVSGHLEVGDAIALGSHLSTAASTTIGTYLSVHTFAGIGDYLEVGGRLSVGDELAVVGKAEMDSTLSVNGFTFIGDGIEVESHASIGGSMEVAEQVSIGGLLAVTSKMSVGNDVTFSESLSVASLTVTPATGVNEFIFNQPITPQLGATSLRIELAYPHKLTLITNTGDVGLPVAVQTAQQTYVTDLTNDTYGVTYGIGQISGFKLVYSDNLSVQQLRYMTELEVLNVEYVASGITEVIHDYNSTIGLTGGQRAPTLSVGGRIILLEDLSVGFDATIAGNVSVANHIVADTLSVGAAFTTTISTQTLFVANSNLASLEGEKMSVASAFMKTAEIENFLSCSGPVLFKDNVTLEGQTLLLTTDLSVAGDAQLNLISVANLHVNMLSVSDAYASELSVHTLFVQQVTTSDPDESFDFNDDAHFQGDLTIEGKLYVKDILYTGPGGSLTIENVASMTIEDNLSIAGHIHGDTFSLGMNNTPSQPDSPGDAGLIAIDTQHLYVCVAANTWRRIAFSSF